ncbi:MAG: adenylate kinase [Gemmatimonadota bacterium]|nr:MAG: adenylate kinase [Gemmatimonadota bacterium]
MNVIILGPPGSGKTTQAQLLATRQGAITVATGDLLGDAVRNDTDLGRKAKQFMDSGSMVPDEIILSLVKEQLEAPEAANGVVLDGFPRTVRQARAVTKLLAAQGRRIKAALLLDVPEDEIIRRLLARATEQGRDDDAAAIQKRIAAYRASNAPLVGNYREQGVLKFVSGKGTVEEIADEVKRAVGA